MHEGVHHLDRLGFFQLTLLHYNWRWLIRGRVMAIGRIG